MSEKHDTCKHAIRTGQMAVYVKPSCRKANMIKGVLVSTRARCQKCERWEAK